MYMALEWRVAASLLVLRDQINKAYPNRNKASDGTIGDARHQGSTSDHNPWVRDGGVGVVTAIDLTDDALRGGFRAGDLAERIKQDPRVKYVIWNRRIYNEAVSMKWRFYRGTNPHTKHVHISVHSIKRYYDSGQFWDIGDVGHQA